MAMTYPPDSVAADREVSIPDDGDTSPRFPPLRDKRVKTNEGPAGSGTFIAVLVGDEVCEFTT